MNRLFPLLIVLIASSCRSYPPELPPDVRAVLKESGKNDRELLEVIDRYGAPEDSLKLQAAYFLIAHMTGKYSLHYEYTEPFVEAYEAERKNHEEISPKVLEIYSRMVDSLKRIYGAHPTKVYDVQVMTADYLISNIDLAFKMWEEPWARKFDFDQFCEFILPYRIHNEPLSGWRSYLIDRYYHLKDSIENPYDTEEFALYVNDLIGSRYITKSLQLPYLDAISADRVKIGECSDRYLLITSAMRALGIPAMIDYTPQKDRSFKPHDWTVYLDTLFRYRPFDGGDARRLLFTKMPPSGSFPANTVIPLGEAFGPTVFRYTYALQPTSLAMSAKTSGLNTPSFFTNPCIKNVTDEYEFPQYTGLEMDVSDYGVRENSIVYVSVFGYGAGLREADWSRVRNGKVYFKALGTDLSYVLSAYKNNKLTPISYPFALPDETTVRIFRPDPHHRQDIILTRKCKMSRRMEGFADNTIGATFEGANHPGFGEAEVLFTIGTVPDHMTGQTIVSEKPYRFVRYHSRDSALNMAEIRFFGLDKTKNQRLLTGKILHNVAAPGNENPENLFDNDIRTNFNATAGTWVGLDLGEPAILTKVEYLPRNNFNVIEPGHLYELHYYYDGEWISLGETVAQNQYLHYKQVPSDALLLLRNKTAGKEERIFTYENGKQLWW